MSIKLMSKVWEASIPANLKLTLLALADFASDSGKCWPSIPTIATKAGKSIRQVKYDLKELDGLSLIRREYRFNNSNLYWLNTRPELLFPIVPIDKTEEDEEINPLDLDLGNLSTGSAESAPQDEMTPRADSAPRAMGCTPGGAMGCTLTITESSKNLNTYISSNSKTAMQQKEDVSTAVVEKPSEVSEQVWVDWLAHRKLKKAVVTKTAITALRREATKAGIGLQEAMEMCVMNGWSGFKASWLTDRKTKEEAAVDKVSQITNGLMSKGSKYALN